MGTYRRYARHADSVKYREVRALIGEPTVAPLCTALGLHVLSRARSANTLSRAHEMRTPRVYASTKAECEYCEEGEARRGNLCLMYEIASLMPAMTKRKFDCVFIPRPLLSGRAPYRCGKGL